MSALAMRCRQNHQAGAPPVTAYKYWRIYITANNGDSYTAIQEILFYQSGAGPLPFGSPSQSSSFPGQPSTGAWISHPNTGSTAGWVTASGAVLPQWTSAHSGTGSTPTPIAPDTLTLYPQDVSGLEARSPKDFVVQGSNDSDTGPWTDVATFTGITDWTAGSPLTFAL